MRPTGLPLWAERRTRASPSSVASSKSGAISPTLGVVSSRSTSSLDLAFGVAPPPG